MMMPSEGHLSGVHDQSFDQESDNNIDVFGLAWRARGAMALAALVFGLLYGGVAAIVWSSGPVRTMASQQFAYTFDGVDRNKYPNGMAFSPQDLLAEPVLRSVYEQLHLSDSMKANEFQTGLSLHDGGGVELSLLIADYTQRLQNAKLTQPEREKLEKEYRAALDKVNGDVFVLQAEFTNMRLAPGMYERILTGVLDAWARYARQTRGVAVYDLAIPKIAAFDPKQSMLDQWAMLAEELEQSERSLKIAALLPGASQVRDAEGGGIPELQRRVAVLRRTRFEPLTDQVYAADAEEGLRRLRSNVEAAEARHAIAKARADASREVFVQYVTMARGDSSSHVSAPAGPSDTYAKTSAMPTTINLPENLINKLVEMRSTEGDLKYRQKLNDDVILATTDMLESQRTLNADKLRLEKVLAMQAGTGTGTQDLAQSVSDVKEQLGEYAASLSNFIGILAERNLSPSSVLYRADGPAVVVAERAVSLRQLAVGMFGAVAIGMAIGLLSTLRSVRATG